MKQEIFDWVIGTALCFGFVIIMFALFTYISDPAYRIQQQAIEHNVAQYDIKNGKWRWRTPEEIRDAFKITPPLVPGVDYDPLPLPAEFDEAK